MYRTLILISLISIISFTAKSSAKTKTAKTAEVSVRKQVDSLVDKMADKVKSSKSPAEQLQFVVTGTQQTKELRKKYPRQTESDEIYLSMLEDSLGLFPKAEEFKKDQCEIYKNDIKVRMEPTAEARPTLPAVAKAYDILTNICK